MFNWIDTTIGEVVTFQRGFDITRKTQQVGIIPVVSSGGISSYHNQFAAEGPGVVIGRKGTLGKVFYLDENYWPHDTSLWVKDFKGNWPKFVYYFMTQVDVSFLDAGSANPTLNRNHLHLLKAHWPRLAIQKAIAEVLGALDDKIAANTKLAQLMEELLTVEAEQKWLGDRSYETMSDSLSISDLIEINPTLKRPTDLLPIYVDMKKLPEAGSGILEWDHRPAQGGARFQQGDTLLARITPCLQNRKTGFVDFLGVGQVAVGSTEFIVMRSKPDVSKPVSYFVAVHSDFRTFAIRHMVGTSGRQRVSGADISQYRIPRPNPEWLQDFGMRAERQFEFTKSLRAENRTLAETRDVLLPQLMSGKLRVRDVEKTVEGVI